MFFFSLFSNRSPNYSRLKIVNISAHTHGTHLPCNYANIITTFGFLFVRQK